MKKLLTLSIILALMFTACKEDKKPDNTLVVEFDNQGTAKTIEEL